MSEKLIFATVGTSLLDNFGLTTDEREFMDMSITTAYDKALKTNIEDIYKGRGKDAITTIETFSNWLKNPKNKVLCAELYTFISLKNILKENIENYKLVLLASDTKEGLICAKALEKFLLDLNKSFFPFKEVILEKITGLQLNDGEKFVEEGLNELKDTIEDYMENHKPENFVISITGGFKAVIPILTLKAMEYKEKCTLVYISSESKSDDFVFVQMKYNNDVWYNEPPISIKRRNISVNTSMVGKS